MRINNLNDKTEDNILKVGEYFGGDLFANNINQNFLLEKKILNVLIS